MNNKKLNFLFETSVDKLVEERIPETKTENGQTFEITKILKKAKPVKVAILRPTRKIYEDAEIYYAIQIATFIKRGLLPYSLVAKRYANDGGALSEPEKQKLAELETEIETLEGEFFKLLNPNDEETKRKNELLIRINDKRTEISNIKNAYAEIYENTAEMKARNKTLEWWSLYLSYIDEDGTGYKPIFGEGDEEKKLAAYEEIYEKEDEFTNECIRKLSYLISFWSASRNGSAGIDFKSMDTLYNESLTDYKVNTDTDVKLEEKTTEKIPLPEFKSGGVTCQDPDHKF